MTGPLVIKFGGELLETSDDRNRIARFIASVAADRPVLVVHGGGRAIDAELARRQIAPKKVDGLRITDAETLEVVVSVLAGSANTALVAALVGANVRAVGLTGVDAGFGRAVRTLAHRSTNGAIVDLGFVGDPVDTDGALVGLLVRNGYVPVVASIGWEAADPAAILNVNADVMACRIAAALPGTDLVIAGGTPGVLDKDGASIPALDVAGIRSAIESGTATAGMVAKLDACRAALESGVASVRIIDGHRLDAGFGVNVAPGTLLTKS